MVSILIDSPDYITVLGGGEVNDACLNAALMHAPRLVCADGGADAALARGLTPEAVIGDFDSLSPATRAALPPARLHHVAEQDSTDFEKCLQRLRAPMILGVGLLGARIDHQLAALSALLAHPHQPCLLLGSHDIAFAAPPQIALELPVGSRLSLYPLATVTGRSRGLEWPIDGLELSPAGQIGTSNRVTGPLRLCFERPGMIVITPPEALGALLDGFAALSPARAR